MISQFNFLSQAHYISGLLRDAEAVLALIPNGDKKTNLVNSMRVFESTVVLTTWGDEDVLICAEDEGIELNESQVREILNYMVDSHECTDDNWEYVDCCIKSVAEDSEK